MESFRNKTADRKLLLAVLKSSIDDARSALNDGAYLYSRYRNNDTILHMAVKKCDVSMIKFINSHVDLRHLKNNRGRTPYQESIYLDHKKNNAEAISKIEEMVFYKFLRISKT
ncbi:MAG: ankyrin repeat domain-containing protein [Candidatus Marsarchaeota archaeon]|nr:ankyrin repeat domain-containing protein [Candidatus Marsarchaeota archaeon]MCL5106303.1 ankyrin repeat domain-containing protein [Candidatus Marsarchaeota archaeon]